MWLSNTGAKIADFFRAGYPDTFPRNGFVAAAALLPQRVVDGAPDGGAVTPRLRSKGA
jgi:hypothetical protein